MRINIEIEISLFEKNGDFTIFKENSNLQVSLQFIIHREFAMKL